MNKTQSKLNLWDTEGFIQFIEDLHNYFAPEIDIKSGAKVMKNIYKKELENKDKPKFKQGELPL